MCVCVFVSVCVYTDVTVCLCVGTKDVYNRIINAVLSSQKNVPKTLRINNSC